MGLESLDGLPGALEKHITYRDVGVKRLLRGDRSYGFLSLRLDLLRGFSR